MLNQRLSIDGNNCTVRYVGQDVPVWPGEDAIGVEWDDPARGKNDGSVKAVKLFECSQPGAGSFLKAQALEKKQVRYGVSFQEAVIERYASESRVEEIKIGTKMGQVLGFDNKGLENLTSINLAGKGVSSASRTDSLPLDHVLHLDLSFDLFSSFDTVLQCLETTPNVEWMSLNGNRFRVDSTGAQFPSLTSLTLTNTLLSEQEVLDVIGHFPNLTHLVLAHNKTLKSLDLRATRLQFLDLSFNQLDNLSQIQLPASLTSLNLAQNNLAQLSEKTLPPSQSITELDVSYNQLQWSDFDRLCTIYPSLTSLRINDNPSTNEDFSTNTLSVSPIDSQIIARWHGTLSTLNGRFVADQERSDSLIYFVNSVLQGKIDYPRQGANKTHFDALVSSLGISETQAAPRVADNFPTARQAFVRVTFTARETQGESTTSQRLNKQSSVQKMKFGVLRQKGYSPLHACTIVIDDIEVYDELKTLDFYGVTDSTKVDICIS
ncbi:Protein PAC2 [Yarrowia sp. B02]|nr:Protein PAC2 [Yarrowia sp. B02]